ncbi:MAG: MarR family transcriptional regulator [Nitrospinae bacterium]|nr:MarR family transcriptional regulator [Nitrospinota bacterium]
MENKLKQYSQAQRQALNAGTKIVRSVGSVGQSDWMIMKQNGLTPSQFGIMETLYHKGPLCQKDLGEKILKSGGNITKVVDNLERDGFVIRIRDEKDRRYFTISLTNKGTAKIKVTFPLVMNNLVKIFSILTEQEQQTLADLCKRIGLETKKEKQK